MPDLPTPADEALAREKVHHPLCSNNGGPPADCAFCQKVERSQDWWLNAIKERCADHTKLMQHCLTSAIEEALAAHVAAQAPSGLVVEVLEKCKAHLIAYDTDTMDGEDMMAVTPLLKEVIAALAAHKAQPVAEVRGMVEAWQPIATAPTDGTWVVVKGRDFELDDGFAKVPTETPEYEVLACCILPSEDEEGFSWRTQIVGCPTLRPIRWRPAALASARHAMGGEVEA